MKDARYSAPENEPRREKTGFLQFVSDPVGNPEDRFSHNEAQIFSPGLLSELSILLNCELRG